VKQLFGGLLLAAGILIMTGSGLCSIAVIVMGASEVAKEPSALLMPLLFGGIPFAAGFGLFKWGQWVLRRVDVGAKGEEETFR
jgi:hypothetical protein